MGIGSEFLENGIVDSKLVRRVVLARKGIGHEQGDSSALRSVCKLRKEFTPALNDSITLARAGIELDQLRVQLGPASGVGEFRVKQSKHFRGARSMEIRNGTLLFLRVLSSRFRSIQDQRNNAVQITRS